jgi:hypothetical protein
LHLLQTESTTAESTDSPFTVSIETLENTLTSKFVHRLKSFLRIW